MRKGVFTWHILGMSRLWHDLMAAWPATISIRLENVKQKVSNKVESICQNLNCIICQAFLPKHRTPSKKELPRQVCTTDEVKAQLTRMISSFYLTMEVNLNHLKMLSSTRSKYQSSTGHDLRWPLLLLENYISKHWMILIKSVQTSALFSP